MTETNRRLVLAARPSGMVDASTTRMDEEPVPELGPGEAFQGDGYRIGFGEVEGTILPAE